MALKRAKRAGSKRKHGRSRRRGLAGAHATGATPLTADDLVGLKFPARTHGELNELEADNILHGWRWAARSTKSRLPELLSDEFARELHRKTFGQVWSWAGEYRLREVNIGVDPAQIATRLRVVLQDAQYWVEHQTFNPEELAIRLHHRVVQVHPFRNGNGRHCRMLADLLLVKHFKQPRLPWGGDALGRGGPLRAEYLAAIRRADAHDYAPLIEFCRTSQ
jgi:Fic-DOC domain mobile mystery protein B